VVIFFATFRFCFQQMKLQRDLNKESLTTSEKGEGQEEIDGVENVGIVVPFSAPPDVFSSIPPILLSHILGALLIYLPQPASVFGERFDLGHEDAVGIAIVAFVLVRLKFLFFLEARLILTTPHFLVRK